MPELETPRAAGYPVLKRRNIDEQWAGAIAHMQQRDQERDGEKILKANGKYKQELVVTLITLGGNMIAGLGDNEGVAQPGDRVRLICSGGAFGQWIDAKNTLGRGVKTGDMVAINTTKAVRYASMGDHQELGEINTQAELDEYLGNLAKYAGKETLGRRGELKIWGATKPEELALDAECETLYYEIENAKTASVELDNGPGPFDDPAPAPQPAAAGAPASSEGYF